MRERRVQRRVATDCFVDVERFATAFRIVSFDSKCTFALATTSLSSSTGRSKSRDTSVDASRTSASQIRSTSRASIASVRQARLSRAHRSVAVSRRTWKRLAVLHDRADSSTRRRAIAQAATGSSRAAPRRHSVANGTRRADVSRFPRSDTHAGSEAKQKKRVQMGIQIAHFPTVKTLEEFEFNSSGNVGAATRRDSAPLVPRSRARRPSAQATASLERGAVQVVSSATRARRKLVDENIAGIKPPGRIPATTFARHSPSSRAPELATKSFTHARAASSARGHF